MILSAIISFHAGVCCVLLIQKQAMAVLEEGLSPSLFWSPGPSPGMADGNCEFSILVVQGSVRHKHHPGHGYQIQVVQDKGI